VLPFEVALAEGMTGELRQQVTLFRSSGLGGPEPEYFPRIESVTDSLGNQKVGLTGDPFLRTNITLRPGEEIAFSGSAWDPGGEPVRWVVRVNANAPLLEATGLDFECTWSVAEGDIGDMVMVDVQIASDRAYHRGGPRDDHVTLVYRVLPPR
jgi:hypothetical protein